MELIFEDDRGYVAIRRQDELSREMVNLAAATVWGSGGTRYRVCDIEAKLNRITNPEFVTLHVGDRLAGFYALLGKQVTIEQTRFNAYYRTFLTLAPACRGRGYGALMAEQAKRHFSKKLDGPGLLYGYVEADNLASLNSLKRAGYESVASFLSTVFSRWRPQVDHRCRGLGRTEHAEMTARLTSLYEDHVLLDFDQSLEPDAYWVLESGGSIVAGVQVETCHWRILSLPGISGALLVHVASRAPGLRRLFDARNCRFLKLGNLYAAPGEEAFLFPLMDSVLAMSNLNSAVIFHDPRSAVFARIRESGRFGILNSGIDATVHVMAAIPGLTLQQQQALRNKPVLISPMDVG